VDGPPEEAVREEVLVHLEVDAEGEELEADREVDDGAGAAGGAVREAPQREELVGVHVKADEGAAR
jgi:hypothetical protein